MSDKLNLSDMLFFVIIGKFSLSHIIKRSSGCAFVCFVRKLVNRNVSRETLDESRIVNRIENHIYSFIDVVLIPNVTRTDLYFNKKTYKCFT